MGDYEKMNEMAGMMMWPMGFTAVLLAIVLILSVAALIKYLFGSKP